LIPNHSIQNNQQLTHAGGNDYLVSFALLLKTLCKCAYNRIKTTGCKRSHIKHTSDVFSAAPDVRFSVRFSRRAVPRGQACKGGDFLPIETAEFGQIGDEHSACLRAYAGSTPEDTVFVFEVVIGIDVLPDEPVDFVYLEVECFYHFLNALFNLWVVNHKQPIGFLSSQVVELPASSDKFGQLSSLWRRMCFRCRFNYLCESGQYLCINGVCFSPLAHTFGKVTYLPRINYNNRQRVTEQFGSERTFIAAGSFKDDESDSVIFEQFRKLAMSLPGVWQLSFEDVWAGCDVKCFFCDIDTDINSFRHGFLPYLQIRTRRACESAAVQTAVRASPTVAARFLLCDGLEDPGTTELSSPAGAGSARFARLASTSFIRQTYGGFTYETIINHN